jgi:hypothetical protein
MERAKKNHLAPIDRQMYFAHPEYLKDGYQVEEPVGA